MNRISLPEDTASEPPFDVSAESPRLKAALKTVWATELTVKQRLYLTARYRDRLGIRAIAAKYGVNSSTVSRTIRRGRTRLRRCLRYL